MSLLVHIHNALADIPVFVIQTIDVNMATQRIVQFDIKPSYYQCIYAQINIPYDTR